MNDLMTLVESVRSISSLPTIFVKVNELIEDPACGAGDVAAVIEKDHALSMRILQLANSAFYGFPGKIDTIRRAVAIVGFNQVRALVLAVSLRDNFRGIEENSPIKIEDFWRHSMACGIASRVLAIHRGDKTSESYFMAGFMHDLGRLVLLDKYPQKYTKVYEKAQSNNLLINEIEQEAFGFTHAALGAELVKYWSFPRSLEKAIAGHHELDQAGEFTELAAVVHVANIMVHAFQMGFSGSQFVPPINPLAWEVCDLHPNDLASLAAQIDKNYEASIGCFI